MELHISNLICIGLLFLPERFEIMKKKKKTKKEKEEM